MALAQKVWTFHSRLCSVAPLDMRKRLLAAIAEMMRMRDDPASFERMFR